MSNDEYPRICNIVELLEKKLVIPGYQRPYTWSEKNVNTLLNDIMRIITSSENAPQYRVGTIILYHNKEENKFEIVDGQQRLVTFALMIKCLNISYSIPILEEKLSIKSYSNIKNNYNLIKNRIDNKIGNNEKSKILEKLKQKIEVVVFSVDKIHEAFQLFDSQNSRGKKLIPQDYLKAYHLRAMRNELSKKQISIIERWENTNPNEIKKLLEHFFRIYQWNIGCDAKPLTVDEIDIYKGITVNTGYSYAIRALKASQEFQINAPIISGKDFFKMIDYYLILKKSLDEFPFKINEIEVFLRDQSLNREIGFNYAKELFQCALIYYYDKFKKLDREAIVNIFKWSFYPRFEKKG